MNPTSVKVVDKRWIDDLVALERSMTEGIPLPNQEKSQGKTWGPWVHRFLFIFTIMITFYMQNDIQNLFDKINVSSDLLRIILQFLAIVSFWGLVHKLLRFN